MPTRAFGDLAVATSAAALLATVTTMGLNVALVQTATQEMGRRGRAGLVSTVRTARHLAGRSTLGGLALLAGTTLLFDHLSSLHAATMPFLALWPLVLLAPASALATGAAKLLHRPALLTAANTSATLLAAVGTVALVFSTRPPGGWAVSAVRALGSTVGFLFLAVPLRQVLSHTRHPVDPGRGPIAALPRRHLLVYGVPALLGTVFAAALTEMDTVLLGAFDGGRAVGRYAPAAAVAATVVTLPGIIGSFYFPLAAELTTRQDHVELVRLYRWATRWSVTLFAPALAVMITCPGALLTTVFGPGLAPMSTPLRLLAIGVAVQLLTGFNGLTLDALGVPGAVAVRQAISLVVTVVACIALIPSLGVDGAALAVSTGFVTANVMCSRLLWHRFRIPAIDSRTTGVLTGLAAGVLGSFATLHLIGTPVLRVLVTGLLTTVTSVIAHLTTRDAEPRGLILSRIGPMPRRRTAPPPLPSPQCAQARPTHA